jgi:ribosomal protein S13
MTTDEQRSEELRVLAANQHVQWLRDSTTIAVTKILDQQIEKLSDYISSNAATEGITDQRIRWQANQLNALRRVRGLMFDTGIFTNKGLH